MFHSLECFIPPYLLHAIAENGTEEQREIAVRTLRVTAQFRGQRNIAPELRALQGIESQSGLVRRVFTASNTSSLPGTLVRSEGDPPSSDVAVNEAFDGAGDTYNLFRDIYNRDSIDNQGMDIESVVHYQVGYDNAFWNGQYMVYGDGDENLPANQRLFNRFTMSKDVIGHELTHGVTNYSADLVYFEQSGALNESMSDVFGSLTRQRSLVESADQADWIIGAGLFTPNVNGVGIRSMKAPGTAYNDPVLGKDPQPAHMSNYVHTTDDQGGVHINSGIPNRAFYITAVEIGGFAWEKAGMIWYTALTQKLQSKSNFQDAANITFDVAGTLYGANSLEQQAVRKGWSDVGIAIGAPVPETPGRGCLPTLMSFFRPARSAGR